MVVAIGASGKIRVDIETKGEFINDLIKKAVDAAYMDIEEVLKFVDGVDGELSSLVKFAIQYMQRAIQKLLGCTEENPEEGKGCCQIVLFSYLYIG
ncbi:hypothetical protein HN51_051681 [Arachis hypogaea]